MKVRLVDLIYRIPYAAFMNNVCQSNSMTNAVVNYCSKYLHREILPSVNP